MLGVGIEGHAAAPAAAGSADEEDGFPPVPRLNIGGTEFQCHVKHLRSQPGSYLTAVFMGEEECEFDAQQRFFFDHDPTWANHVLSYMRTGECAIPYERGAFEAFRKDVQYWRLDSLDARLDVHFQKYIQPQLRGEKGVGHAATRRGPNGMLVHSKFVARQREFNGALADMLAEAAHAALLEGAAYGLNKVTLTSYRPPETHGVSGLPPFRSPDWMQGSDVLYCWDPTFVGFFQPAQGFPALTAAKAFLVLRLEELGFKATATLDANGMSYDIEGTAGGD
jgi:hypothetical protein